MFKQLWLVYNATWFHLGILCRWTRLIHHDSWCLSFTMLNFNSLAILGVATWKFWKKIKRGGLIGLYWIASRFCCERRVRWMHRSLLLLCACLHRHEHDEHVYITNLLEPVHDLRGLFWGPLHTPITKLQGFEYRLWTVHNIWASECRLGCLVDQAEDEISKGL